MGMMMDIQEVAQRAMRLGVAQHHPQMFRFSTESMYALEQRVSLYQQATASVRHNVLPRTMLDMDFNQKPYRVYLAQPITAQPIVGYQTEESAWVTKIVDFADGLDIQVFNTKADDFHCLTYSPIGYYSDDDKFLRQESQDTLDRLIVELDFAVIQNCSALMIDVTQAFSVGGSIEMAYAKFLGRHVIGVIHDDVTPSVWLRHHCNKVIRESDLMELIDTNNIHELLERK